jgi:hypothetical protein
VKLFYREERDEREEQTITAKNAKLTKNGWNLINNNKNKICSSRTSRTSR